MGPVLIVYLVYEVDHGDSEALGLLLSQQPLAFPFPQLLEA